MRLVIVLPLAPLAERQRFAVEQWPLHITVVPPFTSTVPVETVADAVRRVAGRHRMLHLNAGADALFGREEDIPVNRVHTSRELLELRHELLRAVEPFFARSLPPREFAPHVTVKHGARVLEGQQLQLAQIALVDMTPRANPEGRSVLAVAELAR